MCEALWSIWKNHIQRRRDRPDHVNGWSEES